MKNKWSAFVKSRLLVLAIMGCLAIVFATPVLADAVTPGTYRLFDHPDADVALGGPYGLPLDFLSIEPPPGEDDVFSASCVNCDGSGQNAFVTLEWDGLTAVITSSK